MQIKIDSITVERSLVMPGTHTLTIVCGKYKFTGNFDDSLTHFTAAVSTALKYFGQAFEIINVDGAGTVTRKKPH